MKPLLLMLTLSVAIGVVIGLMVPRDARGPEPAAASRMTDVPMVAGEPGVALRPQQAAADIVELRRMLEREVDLRRELELKVDALSRRIAAANNASPVVLDDATDTADDQAAVDTGAEQRWFNQQALIDSGMDSQQASQLQAFFEQLELERLYLRDQSLREDWSREQLRDAMQALEDKEAALKNQLGEAGYDAYLYASGKPNRVAVTDVLASAPAGEAGIQPGDLVLRYDNQRIYSWVELRDATSAGEIGDTVSIEVERDGETLQLYLARGPLGIRMSSVSVAP